MQVYDGRQIQTLQDLDNPGACPTSFAEPPAHYVLRTSSQPSVWNGYFVQNCGGTGLFPNTLTSTPTPVPMQKVPSGQLNALTLSQSGTVFAMESDVTVAGDATILVDVLSGNGGATMTLQGTNTIGAATTGGMRPADMCREGVYGGGCGLILASCAGTQCTIRLGDDATSRQS